MRGRIIVLAPCGVCPGNGAGLAGPRATNPEQAAFGQRLSQLRLRKRLTQAQLARRAGLSVAVVQALEQGVRADPRLSTVLKLAAALGLPVGDLAGEQV